MEGGTAHGTIEVGNLAGEDRPKGDIGLPHKLEAHHGDLDDLIDGGDDDVIRGTGLEEVVTVAVSDKKRWPLSSF